MKKVHLIAIGGAIMHNLAIALKQAGYSVTGSDDHIFDPARSNLKRHGLLPEEGWDAKNITADLDLVILGMHARADNPELKAAGELGIPIVSFPEFIASESKDKTRVVIAGSHGKTTTTAMLMHALRKAEKPFDYLVGSSIDGFELSVRISNSDLIVIEGDEYLSSALDRKSKFLWYQPDISVITGIAYDHINVFPTYASYLETFREYIALHSSVDTIFYFEGDVTLQSLMKQSEAESLPYSTPDYTIINNQIFYNHAGKQYPLSVIGDHNMQDLEAASMVCGKLGIPKHDFLSYMADFKGAGLRMEKIFERGNQVVIRDFAHSPSKLKATVDAVKKTYTTLPLTAVFELHTFSSLNADFLPLYRDSMAAADHALVYLDPEVFRRKNSEPLDAGFIKECFGDIEVLFSSKELEQLTNQAFRNEQNLLLMSSGNFGGAQLQFGAA